MAPNESKPETAPAKTEEKIARERFLSDECYPLTGYERPIVAGALTDNQKSELTTDEVKALCEKWLASPVKEN